MNPKETPADRADGETEHQLADAKKAHRKIAALSGLGLVMMIAALIMGTILVMNPGPDPTGLYKAVIACLVAGWVALWWAIDAALRHHAQQTRELIAAGQIVIAEIESLRARQSSDTFGRLAALIISTQDPERKGDQGKA